MAGGAAMVEDLRLREAVLAVLARIRDTAPLKPPGRFAAEGRDLYAEHVPVLRRYTAGDDVSLERLYLALKWIEVAVFLAGKDRRLFLLAMAARDACLERAGPEVRAAEAKFRAAIMPRG